MEPGVFATPCAMNQTSVRRFGSMPISRVHRSAIKFLCRVYEEAPEPGSHSYAAMRTSQRPRKYRAMAKNLKKGQRIGRAPKTGTELAISPRRVIVFKPSAILKQRVNGHSPVALRE